MKIKFIFILLSMIFLMLVFVFAGCESSEIEELRGRIEKIEQQLALKESMEIESEVIEEEAVEEIVEESQEEIKTAEETDIEAETTNLENENIEMEDFEIEDIAEEIINNGFNLKYIDCSVNQHPHYQYWNYVQVGIIDETIPVSGNWGGPEWSSVEIISQIIRKYYPDSEVWIICFVNDHYAVSYI